MNGPKANFLTPALIGGAVAGVLSGIPIINCLCCLWIIGGAALAAYLLVKDARTGLTSGDGALVGAYAGVVSAAVHSLVNIPFQALNMAFFKRVFERLAEYGQGLPEGWQTWFDRSTGSISIPWFFIGLLLTSAIFAALGALGGIIGMALFNKKAPSPPSVPPPNIIPPPVQP
jgi:hypothetical protein